MLNRRIYETVGIRYDDIAAMADIVAAVKTMLNENDDIDKGKTLMVNFVPSALPLYSLFTALLAPRLGDLPRCQTGRAAEHPAHHRESWCRGGFSTQTVLLSCRSPTLTTFELTPVKISAGCPVARAPRVTPVWPSMQRRLGHQGIFALAEDFIPTGSRRWPVL